MQENENYTTQMCRHCAEFTRQQMHFFYFKKHIKIYITIHINIAPTRLGL